MKLPATNPRGVATWKPGNLTKLRRQRQRLLARSLGQSRSSNENPSLTRAGNGCAASHLRKQPGSPRCSPPPLRPSSRLRHQHIVIGQLIKVSCLFFECALLRHRTEQVRQVKAGNDDDAGGSGKGTEYTKPHLVHPGPTELAAAKSARLPNSSSPNSAHSSSPTSPQASAPNTSGAISTDAPKGRRSLEQFART
jgi:hypothetical protein